MIHTLQGIVEANETERIIYENNQLLLDNLTKLVIEHKKTCNGECTISLLLVGRLVERAIGRALTTEERREFV